MLPTITISNPTPAESSDAPEEEQHEEEQPEPEPVPTTVTLSLEFSRIVVASTELIPTTDTIPAGTPYIIVQNSGSSDIISVYYGRGSDYSPVTSNNYKYYIIPTSQGRRAYIYYKVNGEEILLLELGFYVWSTTSNSDYCEYTIQHTYTVTYSE